MKKTVLFETIDGHEIIRGFDRPTVDPVETAKVVGELIKDTPEYQALDSKKAEYAEAVGELSEIQGKYKKGTKVSSEDQHKWNTALGKMTVRQDELKPLAQDLADKTIAFRREHAIYFEPRAGEVIKTVAEVDALVDKINACKPGTIIALDGSIVHDNRGVAFYRKAGGKWVHGKIVRLGDKVPSDAVLEADVTDTQKGEIELDRVSALPDTEKSAERAMAESDALNMAAQMRNELEIKSDTKALAKSRTAYKAEMARMENLYG